MTLVGSHAAGQLHGATVQGRRDGALVPLLFIGCWLVTGLVIPLKFTSATDRLDNLAVVTAWGLVLLTSSQVARVIATGRPNLVDAAFWTFSYSFLTLPALAQFSVDVYPLASRSFSEREKALACLVILIGLIGYVVGRRVAFRARGPRSAYGGPPLAPSFLDLNRAKLLGVLGLLTVGYAIARYGMQPFFTSRDALDGAFYGPAPRGVRYFEIESKARAGSERLLIQVPVFVAAYVLIYSRRRLSGDLNAVERNRIWPRSLLILLVAANVVVNNPISNARLWFGTVLLAFTTAVVSLDRKIVVRLLLALLLTLSLFSIDRLDAFRRTGSPDFSSTGLAAELIRGPDFASPQQVANGVVHIQERGHTFGRQLLGTLLVPVPRSVWTSKPRDTGDVVAPDAGFNVSAPLWTEGQVDFGLLGVLLFLVAYGYLGGLLEYVYSKSGAFGNPFAPLMPVLAGYGLFFLRGSLMPAFSAFVPVLLLFILLVRRSQVGALMLVPGGPKGARATANPSET